MRYLQLGRWRVGSGEGGFSVTVGSLGVLACLMALALSSGCTSLPLLERESLLLAERDYRRGEVAQAIGRLNKIIAEHKQAVEISEAYYLRGLCRFRLGQERGAVEDFEVAARRSRRPDVVARAKASLAAVSYQRGDWVRAAELYLAAIPDLPEESPTDQILYYAGISLQRIGRWQDARYQFGRILRKFGDRPIAADARRIAGWHHNYYAIQLGAFESTEKAASAVQRFRARGLDAVQENLPRIGRAMWVVMAGRYATYADAQAALVRHRQVESGAFIIPRTH